MDTFTIGKAARFAGVGVETIRFYERKGLIERPLRSGSSYRQYSTKSISRIRFIRRAKELGFTLREIRELLELRVAPASTCDDVRKQAVAKVADINQRIRTLQKMKKALTKLTAACDGQAPVSECPILEALEEPESWPVSN